MLLDQELEDDALIKTHRLMDPKKLIELPCIRTAYGRPLENLPPEAQEISMEEFAWDLLGRSREIALLSGFSKTAEGLESFCFIKEPRDKKEVMKGYRPCMAITVCINDDSYTFFESAGASHVWPMPEVREHKTIAAIVKRKGNVCSFKMPVCGLQPRLTLDRFECVGEHYQRKVQFLNLDHPLIGEANLIDLINPDSKRPVAQWGVYTDEYGGGFSGVFVQDAYDDAAKLNLALACELERIIPAPAVTITAGRKPKRL